LDRRDKIAPSSVSAAPLPAWLRLGDGYLTIEISARPASARRGLLRIAATGPVIGLASAPEKGRANRELIELVADLLEVPVPAVSVIRGRSARQKVLRIETTTPQALRAKLIEWVDGG
jgi:uncharacterized protein YggU (UPF0235/DUF167 family)